MKIRIPKKLIIAVIVCAAAILISLISALCLRSVSRALPSQDAAARWRGGAETACTQVSCFMPENGTLTPEQVASFRTSLDSRMVSEAIEAEEGGSLWKDAYSAYGGKISVSGEHGSSELAATGVGGDFFFFHQLKLLSGSYITEADLMHDCVVLDHESAWRLYGSDDIAGLTVTIRGYEYLIAGVVEPENDKFTEKAYSGGARIYMHYDALAKIFDGMTVSCYEIAMPNPVTGFAKGIMTSLFPIGSGEVVENSGRYRIGQLWQVLKGFSERTMHLSSVAYPYWENAARLTENSAALLLPLVFIPLLVPAVYIVVAVWRAGSYGSGLIKKRMQSRREFG